MPDPETKPTSPRPDEQLALLWERGDLAAVERYLVDAAALPVEQLVVVLTHDQWHRWQRGERVLAEHYLQRYPALADNPEAAVALAYGEFLAREEAGEAPVPEEYLQRFAKVAARLRVQLELHSALGSTGPAPSWPVPIVPPAVAQAAPAGYEVMDEIGRGSMGVVYRAWQTELRRLVALKLLLATASAPARARFRTEAEAVARLYHPNIVQVYAFGEVRGQPFFSMELVEGGTLARLVRNGPLPVRQAAELIATLARAIDYAHTRGVVHRDLKPANVLLAEDGTPRVTDFGLAKLLIGSSEQTATGELLGTPAYMAPEQAGARETPVTPAVDIYALGAILYEMLTGRTPFWADSAVGLLMQVRNVEAIRPNRLRPGLPRDLETICLKCLEKTPTQRYDSAAALADDLNRFLHHEPIRARPVGRLARLWRWSRRNPALATVGGVAVVGLLLAAAVSASFGVYYAHTVGRLSRALAEADHVTAGLALDRGVALCDQGDTGSGLLWLARSLELASKTGDADLERAARINLSAWSARMHPLRQCLQRPERVSGVAFSPDGTRLATSCVDGTGQLWDAATGQPIGGALRHGGAVTAVAFSPDGRHLATGCADGKLYRWEATTGAALGPLGDGVPIQKVLFDPQGRWCLAVGGTRVQVWDLASGTALATLDHAGAVTDAAVSRNGATLLTGTDTGTAMLWELPAGTQRGNPLQHGCPVRSVALHPDGRLAAVGDENGHTVLWNAGSKETIREMPRHSAAIVALAFSPDGEQLLSASRNWLAYLSDVRKPGATPRCRLLHLASVRTASFSPDGKLVLTGGMDGRGRLWDATSGEAVGQPLAFQAAVHSAVFSADGRSVALAGDDKAARVWDVVTPPTPPAPFTYPESLYAATFSRDGTLLATAGEGEELCPIRLWDTATGQPLRVLPGHQGTVRYLDFSGDGTRLASAGGDGHARVWEVATGKTLHDFVASPDWTTTVAFSPDGRLLLVGTRPGDVALWDLGTGNPRTQLPRHSGPVLGAAFSPDGTRWLTGGMDLTARLGTTADGKAVGVPLRHQGQVWSVSFSPDGRLALTGSDDRAVRGWEAETSRPLGAPLVDPFMVRLVQFSPDGRTILKGGLLDGSRLWDVATRKPLGPVLPHPDAVYAAHFTPDGRHVLLAGERLRAARYSVILEPIAGPPERIDLQMRLAAGMELGIDEGLRVLDADTWHARRQRLAQIPAVR
jgi:WD40 repeat protein